MSDNPFAEPDDSDRTVIRPSLGGRRATVVPPPAAPRAESPAEVAADRPGFAAELPTTGLTPLAQAAAPLLQLLARLRNAASEPDPYELRERAVREMRTFERRAREAGVPIEQIQPAHYALCASLDDVVLNTPWGSVGAWNAASLVSTFHHEVRSGERFFDLLASVRQNPGKLLPVLEVMYLCLSLGLQGRYRLSPRGPAEIDRLREETYALIARQRQSTSPELSPRWKGIAAPYHPVRFRVPVWVSFSAALAAFAGVFVWFSTQLNATSDTLYETMLSLPVDHVPAITRAAAVRPVQSPPSSEPTSVDRLRTFLKPEIDEGLVTVVGTASTPVVRIRNRNLFASGSASLEPGILPVLQRIALALKDEPGMVQVIGYTDNQPIRTVRFPSNFQLSAARAEAASTLIARSIGDASRLKSEGRADADPIASNATPEGREQNRRIEVVLHREG
jgi:type VI secretion system protein ImpK